MKLRYVITCASALLLLATEQAWSQIDRNVEVTKAYVPNIEPANKLSLVPDMSDDSYIMPDIDYSITPVSIKSTFDLTHYEAAKMDFMEYTPYPTYYVKASLGYPLESVVDMYATKINVDQNFVMAYLNQSGRYANIENDFGVTHAGSSQSHFRVGATAGAYVGERGQLLRGDLNYTSDLWSRYATSCDAGYAHPLYQRVSLSGQFGDDFLSQRGFNYSVRGNLNHFWSRSDFNSTSYKAELLMGGVALGGKLLGGVGVESTISTSNQDNYTLNGGVEYSRYGDKFRFVIGGRLYYDDISATGVDLSPKSYLVPRLMLDYNIVNTSLIAYGDLDGGLKHCDFGSLSEINPYLAPDLYGEQSVVDYNLDLGIKGVFGAADVFSYNVYASYDITLNNLYWAFVFVDDVMAGNNYFELSQSDLKTFGLNVELEYHPCSSTTLRVEAMAAKYSDEESQLFANGLPENRFAAELRQRFGSSLLLAVKGSYVGSRSFSEYSGTSLVTIQNGELSSEFDLGAKLDYRINRDFMLFGEVNNLLNTNIYKWAHYREYGVNFMIGAKIQF